MENLLQISREPKTLELERTDDGRYRLVITLGPPEEAGSCDGYGVFSGPG